VFRTGYFFRSDGYSESWKLISAHSFLLLSEDVDVHTVGNAMDHGGEGKLATCSINKG